MSSGEKHDFWLNSGFHLLDRDESGRLTVTDDFLRAYFCRPEICPLEDSSSAEFELHAALMQAPRMVVPDAYLDAIPDEDVRDNYRVIFEFRARLLGADSLESAYAGIFSGGDVVVPPLFIDQLVHILLRHILGRNQDPLQLRAAELFFRKQRASIQNGAVMLADFDVIEAHASGASFGNVGRLIAEAQTPLKNVSLDVLERENSSQYWARDQKHDFVIRVNHGAPAAGCFCDVIEQWVLHFCRVRVKVRTISAIEETQWAWHIGLDPEATALLNDLWNGVRVEAGRLERLLCLYRLEFANPSEMRSDIAGRPVYLALCMDPEGGVRVKPQNLLRNLPVAGSH